MVNDESPMTSLISSLSGQFSRAVLLSMLLPATVFVLLALALVWPVIPESLPLVQWAGSLDTEWKLATITLAIVLVTALLSNLNGLIIRFYEGYPWCDSWLGRWKGSVHRRRLVSQEAEWRGLWTLLRQPEAKAHPGYREAVDHWNQLGRELNSQLPDLPSKVLPTRLGNVIRSFESYPYRQYRIRAITVWPRLSALVDKDYAAQIETIKSTLDFTLNGSLLCGLLAALVLGVRLVYPVRLAEARVWLPALIAVLLLTLAAYGLYLAALSRANAWGNSVKGAFDIYRWRLLESLGYRYAPETLEKERELWDWISTRLILSDLAHRPHPGYVRREKPATSAVAEPGDVALEVTRGASRGAGSSALTITVGVRNRDGSRPASGLKIVDAVADGWLYEWDSAGSSLGAVRVSGTNPYTFEVGDLAPAGAVLVTYRILPKEETP